ncbi:MAG: endonuclease/exonuclease/phosphatase family protein [Cumulibacter sp.]
MNGRWAGWSVVGALLIVAAVLTEPVLVGLSTYTPFAHLVALRPALALGGMLAALAVLLCALMVNHRGEDRPTRLSAALAILVLFTSANAGIVLARGASAPAALPEDKLPGDIDVLAFNTLDTIDGPVAIRDLIAEHDPDVVMLPETQTPDAEAIAGTEFDVFMGIGRPGGSAPTGLLVSADLGEYQHVEGPDTEYGLVGAEPTSGSGPVFYAVHIASPVAERMQLWRDELDLVTDICDQRTQVIMAGDYNSTIDHAPLRDTTCLNASVGTRSVGTWPTALPSLLGTPIDHIFADRTAFTAAGSAVVELPGSDHRALLARLRPA